MDHGYWQVTGAGGTSGHYDLTLNYGGGATNQPSSAVAMSLVTRGGSADAWDLDGACDPSSTIWAVSRGRMTSFSDKAIGIGDLPFPVELLSLSATPVDNRAIRVDWTTANERNNQGFYLERSMTPTAGFSEVGWRDGAGTTTTPTNYRVLDSNVEPGQRYYYRLRQIDFDGSITYSNIVEASLAIGPDGSLAVYPNPTVGPVYLSYTLPALSSNPTDEMRIEVYDELGRLAMRQTHKPDASSGQLQLDLGSLSKGVYSIQVAYGQIQKAFRVAKL